MKLVILSICLISFIPNQQAQQHVIHKRFLWESLAKLAQPFIRQPKPPVQQNPPYYNNPYPAPPIFQVQPTAPQPLHAPPTSGQLYLPLPGTNYQPNAPQVVQVPPSSFGSPQPPQYKPMVTAEGGGGPLFYGGGGAPVSPPNFNFPVPQGDVPNAGSQLSISGSSLILSASNQDAPEGYVKVQLPFTTLQSVLESGLEDPTVYLGSSSEVPTGFAALTVNTETVEALRAIAQQTDATRAAEMQPSASDDLVNAIKTAASQLTASENSIPNIEDLSLSADTATDAPETPASDDIKTLDLPDPDPEPEVTLDSDSIFPSEPEKELEAETETETETASSLDIDDVANENLPEVFLASADAEVPEEYTKVILPDDIIKELRRRVSFRTLNAQSVGRHQLKEAYLVPRSSLASPTTKPPLGLVPVHLSREALRVLDDYAKEATKMSRGLQLELPKNVLEKLSNDDSQRVWLINGGREMATKTGSTAVFIAPNNHKPENGYVSVPLSESASNELKTFLGAKQTAKGIPVRAYMAPADKKLPDGHVAVPLPDSILDSVRLADSSSRKMTTEEEKGNLSSFFRDSETALLLAPSRKKAPSSFRKLKLPDSVMESVREAIPNTKLAESATPARDLTAAYLAPAKTFVPPGFLKVTVPETLVKMLREFIETNEISDDTKTGSRNTGAEDSPNLPRKILDALLEAVRRTVGDIVKTTRKNKGKKGASSRDNERMTTADDDEEDTIDRSDDDLVYYQPQYQMSPFFPASASSYPYVDPYHYSGLWTYGEGNQYGDQLAVDSDAQNRNDYYKPIEQGNPTGSVQYEIIQPEFEMSGFHKRQGESVKSR